MDLAPGQLIGTYRIIRLLGQGGMGAVYEVEHTQLGVHYALKTFTLEGGHVDLLKNKFLTEGKVLARLHDPHLVRVFDLNFDEATGMPYFVMDLVLSEDGSPRTLLDVKTEELDEDCVFEWFADLASAIDYIHAQGIVHRDIKLGNVLLSSDGHVVLSDFGISRIFSERLRSDVNAVNTMVSEAVTGARLVMGTQGYMAPEVVWGGEATPASDSYSLGVMFVYLLTGIWYTPASKAFKLLEALEYRWIDVLPRLLSVNPAERPTNLLELVETLRSAPVIEQEKEEEPEAPPRRKRRVLFALAGAAAVVAAAIGYFVFSQRSATAAIDDFDAAFSANGIYEGARR
ncbi:MAG: serine/threonine protein kinase [Kiritimatiellae bacterium]|nr:serine/threonine protein kinase [Kiritimatiellia bacterium]